MAPAKKSKSVNKGFTSASDSSPSKDEKSKQKVGFYFYHVLSL